MLISWLMNETLPDPNDDQGVRDVMERAEKGEIIIVTAQDPSKKEILLNTMSPEAVRKYNSALRRRTTQFLYYDPAVVDLTGRIREYYKQRGEKVPTSADAEHLAYAIHYKVDEFHTFDKGKKGGADLLAMDGNVAGHSLRICKPPFKQAQLVFK